MSEKLSGSDAFNYAYENFTDTVYRVAAHNTSNISDAEDITRDVFGKLLEKTRSCKNPEHLKAWLIRVTVNLCHSLYRSSKRQTELDGNIVAPENGELKVIEYVKALPENYRNAIYLHYYEGYSAGEIAEILGSKQNTVLSWLKRGRELLKSQIGGFDDE